MIPADAPAISKSIIKAAARIQKPAYMTLVSGGLIACSIYKICEYKNIVIINFHSAWLLMPSLI
jgi:hypothetical protein